MATNLQDINRQGADPFADVPMTGAAPQSLSPGSVMPQATPNDPFADVPIGHMPEPSPLLQDPGLLAQRQHGYERLTQPLPPRPDLTQPKTFTDYTHQLTGEMQKQAQFQEQGRLIRAENRNRRLLEIGNKLHDQGQQFDPNSFLGENIDELKLRADFMRSDNNKELFIKFKDMFPFGDLRTIKLSTGENVLVFRQHEGEPFKTVDPQGFEAAATLASTLGATANMQTLAEVVAATFTGRASAGARALAVGLASGLGTQLDSLIEKYHGTETSSSIEQAFQAATSMLFGGTAERLMLFREHLARSKLSHQEMLQRVQEFLRNEGIPEVMIGQIAESPLVRAMFQQSRSSLRKGDLIIRNQQKHLLAALDRRTPDTELLNAPVLQSVQDEALLKAGREKLDAFIRNPSKYDLDQVTKNIVDNWYGRERSAVGKLYDKALALKDSVAFDLEKAQAKAAEIERGVLAVPAQGEDLVNVDPVRGELARALKTLQSLKPRQEPGDAAQLGADAPVEVIKRLRTKFFLLSRPDPGRTRPDNYQRLAGDMYKLLTETLDNPRIAKGEPGADKAFAQAWKEASTANYNFERRLENGLVGQLLKVANTEGSDTAVNVARQLINPDAPEGFKMLMDMASPGEKALMRRAYVTSLMREPENIRGVFRKWELTPRGQENLASLLPANLKTALREYGTTAERLKGSGVQRALDSWESGVDAYRKIFQDTSAQRIKEMVDASPGGKDSEFARGMVAGFYSDILKKPGVIKYVEGERIPDPTALRNAMTQAVEEKKIFAFMNAREAANLDNFLHAISIFSGVLDVGGAMRRGAMAGSIRQFPAVKVVGAAHALATDKVTLAILSSPAGRKLMQSNQLSKLEPGSVMAIRVATAALRSGIIHAMRASQAREGKQPANAPPTAATP